MERSVGLVAFSQERKWGYKDKEGTVKIEAKFDRVGAILLWFGRQ